MNINYFTLCWGDKYFKNLYNLSLKSFFSKKPNNFEKFNHNFFIFTDNKQSIFKKKIKNFFKKKKINLNFVDFSKEINLVKEKKISVWKNLGKFELHSINYSYKNKAKCIFLYPDEIHSENLFSVILKNWKKNLILIPSNEVNIKKIKFKLFNSLNKNQGAISEKKMVSMINKGSLDFVKYAFVDEKYYNSHNSRYYLLYKNILYFKNIHLATKFLDPNIFFKKNSFLQEFYTTDVTLSNKDLNKKIIYPQEGIIFSLEESEEKELKKYYIKNKFLLLFFRIAYQLRFSFNHKDGIDPFSYLRTFKVKTKIKSHSSWLNKFIFFDLFSYINFSLSFLIFIFYYILKRTFYLFKKKKKIKQRLYKKQKWIKSK